jgi:predicted ATPase
VDELKKKASQVASPTLRKRETMKIKVENFQSIKNTEIEVKGLTVITGENSIGKSALARAFNGVFTNLRGNAHVRNGESHSSVCVSFEDGNEVLWEKGKKVNRYVVNGKEIAKVGSGVPDEVKSLGVSGVEVDGKELYPQIAKQFQNIFLLDLPPSALSSALSDVNVIQQLEKASAKARSEVRDIKSRMKVKREDLTQAQSNLNAYVGFDYSKVLSYEQAEQRKNETEALLLKAEKLAEKRAKITSIIDALSEADRVTLPKLDQSKFSHLDEAVTARRKKNKIENLILIIEVGLDSYSAPVTPNVRDTSEIERLRARRVKLSRAVGVLSDIAKAPELIPMEDHSETINMLERKKKLGWGIVLVEKEIRTLGKERTMVQKKITEGICPVCLREGDSCLS